MARVAATIAVYAAYLRARLGSRMAWSPRRVPRPRRVRPRHRRPARAAAGPLRMSSPYLIGAFPSAGAGRAARAGDRCRRGGGRAVAPAGGRRWRGGLPLDLQPDGDLRSPVDDAEALALMSERSGLASEELAAVVYRLHDDDVALHLFRVAAGLDSLVPGEGQILGQVRAAFDHGVTRAAARPDVPRGDSRRQEGSRARRRSARCRLRSRPRRRRSPSSSSVTSRRAP